MKAAKAIAKEVIQTLLPILLVVLVMQLVFIRPGLMEWLDFVIGVLLTAVGMFLYQLGAKLGLLPMGNAIGSGISLWGTTVLIVMVFLTIGFAITMSEPNVAVLSNLVESITDGKVSGDLLQLSVAYGAGIMLIVAIICMIRKIPFKYLYLIGYGVVLIISFFVPADYLAMAFDAGGFSSGLISNPFLLTTGTGIASLMSRRGSAAANGFGIIGFTALGPILAVMIIGLFV